ncbi:protein Lto1p [[Candida] railenensis]|uniref:Protein Lto1p n=1 Tax=[Candida] railenensis TaxID=45579 RepID=A0A9P0W097_9ASCO|nr:protein Lto1p [[Candida] railenensis]
MADFDFDQVLNLEEEYYNEGFKEGQEFSTKEQYIEGKEYGYQTGFQRFVMVGYMKGLLESWRELENPSSSLENHLNQLESLINTIQLTNGDEEVAIYEKNISKARNKLRVIATLTKDSDKVNKLDELVKNVGGSLQVSENVDDMW